MILELTDVIAAIGTAALGSIGLWVAARVSRAGRQVEVIIQEHIGENRTLRAENRELVEDLQQMRRQLNDVYERLETTNTELHEMRLENKRLSGKVQTLTELLRDYQSGS